MILAFVLSSAYSSLEDITYNNIQADIKKNILSSLGFTPSNEDSWTTEKVEQIFNESIVSFVINKSGNVIPDKLPEDLDPKVDTDLYPLYKKIVDGQYSESEFLSSFVGFFPKEDPQLLALIIIDGASVSSNYHWGSMSAAPVFKSVMQRIINIDKEITDKKFNKKLKAKNSDPVLLQKNDKKSQDIEIVEMPNVIGKNVNSAFMTLAKKGLNPKIVSGMGVIISQSVEPGSKIEKGTRVELKAEIKS